ncbi:MAG: hypothetical protein GWM98_03520, partial [Nitrospinaceae bacterium]|nr:hypothetical protein [Nitrospinaceae bacterium]NIR53284.1 hypothetical protein [Nitrospinaceae bacterium]NIS83685.1 hypothetical protein [Nitrospinaceae bacterium]NIT80958.1 hypothetical protein [Nitrospinaceae bacterium]NIU42812.1 hypothetical protein [Nitrospinaceae bacterium]
MVDEEKNKEDIPEDEPGNEEPVSEETAPRSEGPEAGSLENRVTRLADALEGFSSEL